MARRVGAAGHGSHHCDCARGVQRLGELLWLADELVEGLQEGLPQGLISGELLFQGALQVPPIVDLIADFSTGLAVCAPSSAAAGGELRSDMDRPVSVEQSTSRWVVGECR